MTAGEKLGEEGLAAVDDDDIAPCLESAIAVGCSAPASSG